MKMYVFQDVHHLLLAQKGQGKQFLASGGIDIYPVSLQFKKILV